MSSLRRHIMMQQGQSTPDYIQDGLVFWLDGINKGATNGNWVDLIGGVEFTNNGVKSAENGFFFPSSKSGYFTDGTDALYSSSTGTIEVCFQAMQQDTFMVVFSTKSVGNLCAGIRVSGGNYCSYHSIDAYASSFEYVYAIPNLSSCKTLSMNMARAMSNLTQCYLSNIKGGFSELTSATTMIGGRQQYSGTGKFYGYIYSIRIYNRQLTIEEMLNNQQIDNERFNLGL